MANAKQRANAAIEVSIAQSDAVISLRDANGRESLREIKRILRDADKRLAKRLLALDLDGELTFSVAQAVAYRAQIAKALESLPRTLGGVAKRNGKRAMSRGQDSVIELVAELEREFKGVAIPPALRAAMKASTVLRGREAVLVSRVATSFDRYGERMSGQFARILQTGLASGATVDQMTASLVAHGGPRGIVSIMAREVAPGVVERLREDRIPEGLFTRYKYWAERIVRTETAYAYNAAKIDTIAALDDGIDRPKKKIVAVFDNRTAPDSIAVHGQIRELNQPFQDGAGRVYMHPPGRPNDRETVIPWFDDWPETDATRPERLPTREAAMEAATSHKQG